MAEPAAPSPKTPRHLWVIGIVSLLWNSIGVLDFTMTQTRNAAYMKGFTPEQLAFFYGFPAWVNIAWGVAVWSGAIGSLLLLLRRGLAVPVFLVSCLGTLLTFIQNYGFAGGLKIGGTGALLFSLLIFAIGVLLLLYARIMRGRAVLR